MAYSFSSHIQPYPIIAIADLDSKRYLMIPQIFIVQIFLLTAKVGQILTTTAGTIPTGQRT